MQVHICQPYRTDKNLGKAYNEAMRLLPDDWWACFLDWDVQLLTPDAGAILHHYAERNPNAGLMTCYTNRLSQLNKTQLLNNHINPDSDIANHIRTAEKFKESLYQVSKIENDISGFLMMVPKSIWKDCPFPETGKCLGVDTIYGRRIRLLEASPILRMEGLYAWHTYRLTTGVLVKDHLS